MTNYEKFREQLKMKIQDFLGPEVIIEYSDIKKNNGNHYEGLCIMGRETQMFPILDIWEYYHYYLERNCNMDEVVERVRGEIAYPESTENDLVGVVRPFEEIKDNIYYGLINYEANRQRLKGLLHSRFLDLAVVLYIAVHKEGRLFATILIPRALAELWQTDYPTLYGLAGENMKKQRVIILTIPQILEMSLTDAFKTSGYEPKEIRGRIDAAIKKFREKLEGGSHLLQRMLLLTNSFHCYGAACILCPDVLYTLAGREKRDLYILPVSIHSVLIVPVWEGAGEEYLKDRISEISRAEQGEKDWLSGHLYQYIAERDVIVEV